MGAAQWALGATRRGMGRCERALVAPGGPVVGEAPAPPPPCGHEAAEPAPEPRQPRAGRRLRCRLVGHRDRRHVGAHRLRAAVHLQRRDGVRLRHGVAADPHGGRVLQHLLPRRQRPPRHTPDRRHPHPAADRGAADHQHAASRVRGVHRMAHLPGRRRGHPHLAQRQRVREGVHRPRRGAAPRRGHPRRGSPLAHGAAGRSASSSGRAGSSCWSRATRPSPRCAPSAAPPWSSPPA